MRSPARAPPQCLGSGITTTADASFSGAAAPACRDLGLRGLVALEVFGQEPERVERFHEKHERVGDAWGELVRARGLAARPVHGLRRPLRSL